MADQRAVNNVQDSVHEDTEMHEVGGETDRPDNEYGDEEDADYYEDDYPAPTMMRDMFFENNTEELGYLLSLSESRAPSPDPSSNADMGEQLTAEEERSDDKYRISRLTYHLSLSNTANERLQDARTALIVDLEKAKEAAKEAVKDGEEKVRDLKVKLEAQKQAAISDAIAQERKVAQLQLRLESMTMQTSGIAQPAAAAPAAVAVPSTEVAMPPRTVAVAPIAIAIGAQGTSSFGDGSSSSYNRVIKCKHCASNGLPCDSTRDSCAECTRNGAECTRPRCHLFVRPAASCYGGACGRLHKDD